MFRGVGLELGVRSGWVQGWTLRRPGGSLIETCGLSEGMMCGLSEGMRTTWSIGGMEHRTHGEGMLDGRGGSRENLIIS